MNAPVYGILTASYQPLAFAPTLIKKSLFGFASNNWPRTTATPPSYVSSIGSISNYADSQTFWGRLHTATNTINWAVLDAYVANAQAAGVTEGTYQIYGTPTFLASTGTGTTGPWNMLGEGAYPSNGDLTLSQTTYFCTQFALRNISTWGRFFKSISAGNEMDFRGTASSAYYWWGTASQFVDFSWTVRAAFAAADPLMAMASPGQYAIEIANYGMDQWVNVAGTLNPTKRGYDTFDIFSAHPYGAGPTPAQPGQFGDLRFCSNGSMTQVKKLLSVYGKTISGYTATEWGISSNPAEGLATFLAQSAAFRSNYIERMYMMAPMQGCSSIHPWFHGASGSLSGDWINDTAGVINGYTLASTNLSGKTVVSGGYFTDGRVTMTFSDNTTRTV
jgi:hypothetical protein